VRIVLFTGKGGVGKTTVAAATAAHAAAAGLRTVVCSTDAAHSLADVFRTPLDDRPRPVGERLDALQVDARRRLEEVWGDVHEYLVSLLDWAGADSIEAEELAVLPGLEEVFALAEIRALADSGEHDLVVVDCAPTAETLRLLSLPDVLAWYMDRVFPAQRNVTRAVRPLLARMVSMPVAGDRVFAAVRRFYDRIDGVRDLLSDGAVTSARLVVNPEQLVVAEARRTYSYLALFGYHCDAVIANRILPDHVDAPFFDAWKQVHAEQLRTIEDAFSPTPVLRAELAPYEVVGIDRLADLGASIYGSLDPAACLCDVDPYRVDAVGEALVLSLPLPHVSRDELELGRADAELYLAVGPYRRAMVLPESLRRREVGGARFAGDRLEVEFVEAR